MPPTAGSWTIYTQLDKMKRRLKLYRLLSIKSNTHQLRKLYLNPVLKKGSLKLQPCKGYPQPYDR